MKAVTLSVESPVKMRGIRNSHQFRIDQPFKIQNKPLSNVTRLIVPGASDVRAVRINVTPEGLFDFSLLTPKN